MRQTEGTHQRDNLGVGKGFFCLFCFLQDGETPTLDSGSRVPWTVRRSSQSILKEISPECSLEGLMLKLKLQYFGKLIRRTNSLEKTLMLGKIEGTQSKSHINT